MLGVGISRKKRAARYRRYLSLIGGPFRTAAYLLPFAHGVDGAKAALAGNWAALPGHLLIVAAWAAAMMAAAILLFKRKMVER